MSADTTARRRHQGTDRHHSSSNKPLAVRSIDQDERDDETGRTGALVVTAFSWLVMAIFCSLVLSRMITETWLWGYDGQYSDPKHVIRKWTTPQQTFTEAQLRQFDGTDPSKPIYLAVMSDVFDVSAGRRMYGPGGSYHHFAGRDGSRAFTTGCFETDLTHDTRGLSEKELRTIQGWHSFFERSKKYWKVGKVLSRPIDPDSPIPLPCKNGKGS
ncbi:uncharacterized protein L969DRAFT_53809 [Mixia osmundae IAM 14324]|uniref:Cytochrome b5 heme-binding domain-containing protein n=1 Tax=Mixia osmundae (strain CBS 9802 / IAM 14324 / JCM 22182 / KY 12970) TaxID=764103 RepID=G7DST9_MIXOS|nr:uncharacterized protein L969DRAFT_53809 [Mixia osmundae IAM 14324]KEI37111.1 hypothetical protein L969DRAFT_53809 [Mixia osmundae IAM 14324]GAA93649.1 hypothetical protein E5Q_00294 [Mixia osmundae IAM 14324]